jgi:aspartate dehydrogenase
MTQAIALIGYGAIGRAVHRLLLAQGAGQAEVVAILARDRARVLAQSLEVAPLLVGTHAELVARRPVLVVECAGHQAVDDHAVATLKAGMDLLLVSVGALADAAREQSLVAAARAAGKRLILPSGAIGGIDWLAAARTAGLTSVTYRSRKPPQAWAGSAAEQQVDLASLKVATTFFRGTAREAALMYPRNANVAATVALGHAGL